MTVYIVRRLLWLPVVLFVVSVITLAMGLYGPGDPVQVMLGLRANREIVERVRHEYGLDQPFPIIYLNYVGNVLHGNFGYGLSRYNGQPVGSLIAERLPITVQLNVLALGLGSIIGIPLGLITGLKRNSWLDYLARFSSLTAISIPLLFLLPFLTFIFSRRHDIFIGTIDIPIGPLLPLVGGRWDGIFSTKVILPVFLESLGFIAVFTRQMRAGIIDTLGQDYVRTARAKGLREQAVLFRHAMRNALIPIATIIGLSLGALVEGSFLVESWFGIPGVGQLAFVAFTSKEYYVVLAVTLLIAVAYVFSNLLVDFLYPILDPRIRRS
jgi:peptide/nickel transport system permease protein